MKSRVISFFEVEERVRDLVVELENKPVDADSIIEKGKVLPFMINLCISQMQAINSNSYPDKDKHHDMLQQASKVIKYKMNTCTYHEIKDQVNTAHRIFGVH